ncbi:MAG: hypothetical protein IPG64_07545 [Haliea sp.]|nr:hypothetical protein [Haliea sp.]
MRTLDILPICIALLLLNACSHPIEIEGEGDVISASGDRNCLLEDFQAGLENCSENYVVGAYDETYSAAARPGWFFDHWVTYCQNAAPPNYDCPFNIPEATVKGYWGQTMPPLRAVFKAGVPLSTPAVTDQIVKISSVTDEGYAWDYYRNEAYPCASSGYQTFILGRKEGASSTATAPLLVKMHGGGVGFFDSAGAPRPNAQRMDEESRSELLGHSRAGLMADVKGAGYRILVVSMCSHDLYAGFNNSDPNNPNTTPGGAPRPTTGLVATKSAIQFAQQTYPTDDTFLLGGSAGSAGTIHVAWAMQAQGIAPDGIIPDASVLNRDYEQAKIDQQVCAGPSDAVARPAVAARMHPSVSDPINQPHLLVTRGILQVPILHVWNKGDTNTCGATPIQCPVNGTTVTLGSTECMHRPLTLAIDGLGTGSRSKNLPLCVEGPDGTTACDKHVVTNIDGTNTLAGGPADYSAAIWSWVQLRRGDD